jgi:transcriptional regulator with XRE-family HTH domain
MLPLVKIKEAERLLAEGQLSQRKIATAVGISRATVSAIASGRRPDYARRQLARAEENELWGPIIRCPECGGRVYSPCRLCCVRRAKEKEQKAARDARRRTRELAIRRLLPAVQRAG